MCELSLLKVKHRPTGAKFYLIQIFMVSNSTRSLS